MAGACVYSWLGSRLESSRALYARAGGGRESGVCVGIGCWAIAPFPTEDDGPCGRGPRRLPYDGNSGGWGLLRRQARRELGLFGHRRLPAVPEHWVSGVTILYCRRMRLRSRESSEVGVAAPSWMTGIWQAHIRRPYRLWRAGWAACYGCGQGLRAGAGGTADKGGSDWRTEAAFLGSRSLSFLHARPRASGSPLRRGLAGAAVRSSSEGESRCT